MTRKLLALLPLVVACNGPLSDADMDSVFMGKGELRTQLPDTNEPTIGSDAKSITEPEYTSQCLDIEDPSIDVSYCRDQWLIPVDCPRSVVDHWTEEGVTTCVPINSNIATSRLLCCIDTWSET